MKKTALLSFLVLMIGGELYNHYYIAAAFGVVGAIAGYYGPRR
jgi:hypothetical protein